MQLQLCKILQYLILLLHLFGLLAKRSTLLVLGFLSLLCRRSHDLRGRTPSQKTSHSLPSWLWEAWLGWAERAMGLTRVLAATVADFSRSTSIAGINQATTITTYVLLIGRLCSLWPFLIIRLAMLARGLAQWSGSSYSQSSSPRPFK